MAHALIYPEAKRGTARLLLKVTQKPAARLEQHKLTLRSLGNSCAHPDAESLQ
jgi:hypothetical protein